MRTLSLIKSSRRPTSLIDPGFIGSGGKLAMRRERVGSSLAAKVTKDDGIIQVGAGTRSTGLLGALPSISYGWQAPVL